jgi:Domain of unknown function (DUF932)
MNATLDTVLPALPQILDFDPVREPQIRNGVAIRNQYWVVNPNTDTVIGNGKSIHNPQNFSKVWDSFREGLLNSGLDTSEAEVKFSVIKEGAAMDAQIVLKRYQYEQVLGEPAKMTMSFRDSHDQSIRRQIRAMIYRLACLNGMIAPREAVGIVQKHTTYSDPDTVGKIASKFPDQLLKDAQVMRLMQGVKVQRADAIDFLERNVATYPTKTGTKVNKKWLDRIVGIHDSYNILGDNTYHLYNTLTHISTHVESRTADVATKRIRIEQDIESVIRGEEFQTRFMPELLAA